MFRILSVLALVAISSSSYAIAFVGAHPVFAPHASMVTHPVMKPSGAVPHVYISTASSHFSYKKKPKNKKCWLPWFCK